MDRKKIAIGMIGHGPGYSGSTNFLMKDSETMESLRESLSPESKQSFVLKIDPDRVKELEILRNNIFQVTTELSEKLKALGNPTPFHSGYIAGLESAIAVAHEEDNKRNRVILVDYLFNSEIESEMVAYEKIHQKALTEESIQALKNLGYATGMGLAEAIASVNRASLAINSESHSFSDMKDKISMAASELCSLKLDDRFTSEAKVEQYQNKTLGVKVGGKKHKKNPFNFRR